MDFGSGKQRCFLPIHDMLLDPAKVAGLRFFMALTGCDQVSFFAHVSKATAWKVWNLFPEVDEIFATLSNRPTEADIKDAMPLLERFVVLLYHRTSNCSDVNSCRRELFCKGRAIDNIPPTQGALFQHVKRAAYIGGYVWGSSLMPVMDLPSFEDFGWNADASPHWSDVPQASQGLRELIKCNCAKGCTRNCKCRRAPLPCTSMNFVNVKGVVNGIRMINRLELLSLVFLSHCSVFCCVFSFSCHFTMQFHIFSIFDITTNMF